MARLRQAFAKGKFDQRDLSEATFRIQEERQATIPSINERLGMLQTSFDKSTTQASSDKAARNMAEYLDITCGTNWQVEIHNSIGRHCGAWYDKGQAI